jgi:PAS domain S-box-containing protein
VISPQASGSPLPHRAEDEREHFALVVQSTQDAVLSKNLDGVLTSWNPAAERLYGYSAAEAIGQRISFLIPPDHKNEEYEILARVRRGERVETYETERIRKDGVRIDVSLTISPIEHPGLGIVGASVIARDVTAEKRRRRAQEFLVAATRGLDASLDFDRTARTIVEKAVPDLAELCVLDFVRRRRHCWRRSAGPHRWTRAASTRWPRSCAPACRWSGAISPLPR